LIASWRRTGLSAAEFAIEHGLRTRTLQWWRWNLGRRHKRCGAVAPAPRLVPVEVVPDVSDAIDADYAWELRDERGLLLRVRTSIGVPELDRVLLAMGLR
jgi:transposase